MALQAQTRQIRKQLFLMGGDTLIGLFCIAVTVAAQALISELPQQLPAWALLFLPTIIFTGVLFEVYRPGKWFAKERLLRSLFAMVLALCILLYFLRNHGAGPPGGAQLVCALLLFVILQNIWQRLFYNSSTSLTFAETILVIGTASTAQKVEKLLATSPGRYRLAGYIGTAKEPVTVAADKVVGTIDEVVNLAREYRAQAIVIALTERRGNLEINKMVTCKLMGVRIIDYPSFFETMTGKIPVEDINPSWLVQSSGFLITPFIRQMKRLVDVLFATIVLIASLPLWPFIALGVKMSSPGPIFYFQQRVGVHGELFTIYKFRSMKVDAEAETGASWAQVNDTRITPIGSFLRKMRLDELPQLFNVLKGDMSFIGPRPERPEFVEKISAVTPYYRERHAVKPGITGWAQVMYPYGASLGDSVEKLRYDLYYINNISFFLELVILLETVRVVLFGKGGR